MASKRSSTFTFLAAASESNAFLIDENVLTGFLFDANWSAGDVTFKVSLDNVTFVPVYRADGTIVKLTGCAPSTLVAIAPSEMAWAGLWLKLVSSVPQTSVVAGNSIRIY